MKIYVHNHHKIDHFIWKIHEYLLYPFPVSYYTLFYMNLYIDLTRNASVSQHRPYSHLSQKSVWSDTCKWKIPNRYKIDNLNLKNPWIPIHFFPVTYYTFLYANLYCDIGWKCNCVSASSSFLFPKVHTLLISWTKKTQIIIRDMVKLFIVLFSGVI